MAEEAKVNISRPNLKHVVVPLEGVTGLIPHRFSETAIKKIEDKQQDKTSR